MMIDINDKTPAEMFELLTAENKAAVSMAIAHLLELQSQEEGAAI